MATYKLYYFNGKGRAELTRTIFKQAGVDFEDFRFPDNTWASEYKAQSPFGVAPWLEVTENGVVTKIGGSMNIARFVAERVGLAGANDVENAVLAGIADCYLDCAQAGMKGLFVEDETEKAKQMEQFRNDCSKWFEKFESMINDDGWLYGNKLTWVDIAVGSGVHFLSGPYTNAIFEKYPKLLALSKRVLEQPNIAEWVKTRPVTKF